jgi:hypothetical protein
MPGSQIGIDYKTSLLGRKALIVAPQIETFTEAHRPSCDRAQAEGTAESEARERSMGKAEALLMILKQRRLGITQGQARHVLACTELATLDRWLGRALSIASVDELFV